MKALLDELGNLSATYGRTELEQACKTFFSRGHGAVRQKRKRIPRAWVLEALDRQGGVCAISGEPLPVSDAVGDHIIPINPREPGDPVGRHTKWNIQAVSRLENAKKSNRSPMEESKRRGKLITEMGL